MELNDVCHDIYGCWKIGKFTKEKYISNENKLDSNLVKYILSKPICLYNEQYEINLF